MNVHEKLVTGFENLGNVNQMIDGIDGIDRVYLKFELYQNSKCPKLFSLQGVQHKFRDVSYSPFLVHDDGNYIHKWLWSLV